MQENRKSNFEDAAWCEAQYNPRVSVSNAGEFAAKWAKWAAEARENMPPTTFRYGKHIRNTLDLFQAPNATKLFTFIHGGYFRAFSKDEFSWVAQEFLKQDISVAIINYPLCPEVSIERITKDCQKALELLQKLKLNMVLAGHSAGGYLTHALSYYADAAMPISGVFNLSPLCNCSMNEQIKMSLEQAKSWSLHETPKASHIFAVGGSESHEFLRQSQEQAALNNAAYLPVENTNHFTVIEQFLDPQSPLFKAALSLFKE
jgi:arylformamidase